MELERAVSIIMDEMYRWMQFNIKENKKAFIATNFASVLIHHCKILKNTDEFKLWHSFGFLKPKFLSFDFDDEFQLKYARWYNSGSLYPKDGSIQRLNEEISDYISSKKYSHFIENSYTVEKKTSVDPQESKLLIDTSKLEAFSFAT